MSFLSHEEDHRALSIDDDDHVPSRGITLALGSHEQNDSLSADELHIISASTSSDQDGVLSPHISPHHHGHNQAHSLNHSSHTLPEEREINGILSQALESSATTVSSLDPVHGVDREHTNIESSDSLLSVRELQQQLAEAQEKLCNMHHESEQLTNKFKERQQWLERKVNAHRKEAERLRGVVKKCRSPDFEELLQMCTSFKKDNQEEYRKRFLPELLQNSLSYADAISIIDSLTTSQLSSNNRKQYDLKVKKERYKRARIMLQCCGFLAGLPPDEIKRMLPKTGKPAELNEICFDTQEQLYDNEHATCFEFSEDTFIEDPPEPASSQQHAKLNYPMPGAANGNDKTDPIQPCVLENKDLNKALKAAFVDMFEYCGLNVHLASIVGAVRQGELISIFEKATARARGEPQKANAAQQKKDEMTEEEYRRKNDLALIHLVVGDSHNSHLMGVIPTPSLTNMPPLLTPEHHHPHHQHTAPLQPPSPPSFSLPQEEEEDSHHLHESSGLHDENLKFGNHDLPHLNLPPSKRPRHKRWKTVGYEPGSARQIFSPEFRDGEKQSTTLLKLDTPQRRELLWAFLHCGHQVPRKKSEREKIVYHVMLPPYGEDISVRFRQFRQDYMSLPRERLVEVLHGEYAIPRHLFLDKVSKCARFVVLAELVHDRQDLDTIIRLMGKVSLEARLVVQVLNVKPETGLNFSICTDVCDTSRLLREMCGIEIPSIQPDILIVKHVETEHCIKAYHLHSHISIEILRELVLAFFDDRLEYDRIISS